VSCRRTRGLLYIAALAFALCPTACRQRARGIPSIAILPFDNLTPGRGYDWLSAAGPALLDWQLFGQKESTAFTASSINEAVAGHATSYLHTRFQVVGGMLAVDAAVENSASDRIATRYSFRVADSPEGALSAVGRLARSLAPGARRVNANVARALVPFGEALTSTDTKLRAGLLEGALNLAPDFTPAWLARIERNVELRSASASDDIAAAMPYADALDRARLRYLQARLSDDPAAQIAALADLTWRAPAQASAWQTLAELQTNTRNFPAAAVAWTTVTRLQPWNDAAFNQLGYCRAWAGDASGARSALAYYQLLDPQNPNPLDSLGEVQFFLGQYADAEKSFLRAAEKDPAFLDGIDLLKAAEARLMTGDRNDADKRFHQFLDWRGNALHDPLAPLWRARWDFLSGRRREAMTALASALRHMSGEARSRAESQYSFWLFASGDSMGARAHADQALQTSQTPASRGLAMLCHFLALPSASADAWTSRANKALGDVPPRFRESALAYALALDRHSAEAIPLLERVVAASAPGDDGEQRAMLVSALLAVGRRDEAHKLLGPMPIPMTSDEAEFSALVFPRWLSWVGQGAGFRTYSGNLHLVFE
jgi:tetratricopeptide (TPR) repeat protein